MATRHAWVLNLDSDLELASRANAGDYTPRRAVVAAMQPHAEHLRRTLLGADDVVVDESFAVSATEARTLVGRAFCLTPSAARILRERGIEPEPHPSIDILRRVNSRAFCAELGQTLPDAAFVESEDEARAMVQRAPAVGRAWRLKRAFGMAGRGQRIIDAGEITPQALAFARAWFAEGGVQIEPHVTIAVELGMHGMIARDGGLRLGALVAQRCDAQGAWIATERVTDDDAVRDEDRAQIAEEAVRVGAALCDAGYFGAFGIDAFTYDDLAGARRLQPRSEINARYSMGFAAGFGRL